MGSDDLRERIEAVLSKSHKVVLGSGSTTMASLSDPDDLADAVLDALRSRVVCKVCHSNPCRGIKPTAHRADFCCYRLAAPSSSEGVGDGE